MTIEDTEVSLVQLDAARCAIETVLKHPKAYSAASFHDLHGMLTVIEEIRAEVSSGGVLWV